MQKNFRDACLSDALRNWKEGNFEIAVEIYEAILNENQHDYEVWHALGLLCFQIGKIAEARDFIERALSSEITPDYLSDYANVLFALDQKKEAESILREAVRLYPDNHDLWLKMASQQESMGMSSCAMESYEQAIYRSPNNLDAWRGLGKISLRVNDFEKALTCINRVLAIEPESGSALIDRGLALEGLGRLEESLDCFDKLCEDERNTVLVATKKALILHKLGRMSEAIVNVDHALNLEKDNADTHFLKGAILGKNLFASEAIQEFSLAARIKPDFASAHWNEALFRLLLGDFELGFEKFEWRKTVFQNNFQSGYKLPLAGAWSGNESVSGKNILLWTEQGLGDSIQFVRYVPLLNQAGARVFVLVPETLKRLFSSISGIEKVLDEGDNVDLNYHCSFLSLPYAFRTQFTSIPSQTPYLEASSRDVEYWREKVESGEISRIGLVWSGNPTHRADQSRSIPLTSILATLKGEFTSLHLEIREDEQRDFAEQNQIQFVGDQLRDMADTAALISALDLVITVDTSVAHLAGALNKPVWILIDKNPDWRWMLERTDSPWYPSAKLFRRGGQESWGDVLMRVNAEMSKFSVDSVV